MVATVNAAQTDVPNKQITKKSDYPSYGLSDNGTEATTRGNPAKERSITSKPAQHTTINISVISLSRYHVHVGGIEILRCGFKEN